MGALYSLIFGKKDPKTPIKGFVPRIKNIVVRHHRGLVGSLVPLFALPPFITKGDHPTTVAVMWVWMAWFFLLQPVSVPATGLIPIFLLPMAGAIASDNACGAYMNEGIAMFILANMVLLLWNNSGLDRRLALWFLCSGDTSQFSSIRLVFKCAIAGFFLSMFSNKLIVSNIMIQYMTKVLTDLKAATAKGTEPNYDEVRYIINNVIQTSCSIGGIVFIHTSYATLAFRAIFQTAPLILNAYWYDVFNYIEFTSFTLPMAILMLIVNCGYNILLLKVISGKKMSDASKTKVRNALRNNQKDIPNKMTLHEKITLFFSILSLVIYFTRWCRHFNGWGNSYPVDNKVPSVRDSTVAAMFAIFLHALPSGFRFVTIWLAKKKSEFGKAKPESGILWWRFVDKNIPYAYLFLIGSGVALGVGIFETKLSDQVPTSAIGKIFNGQSRIVFLLLVCLVSVILPNIMSSVAGIVIFLPLVMNVVKATVSAARRLGDISEPVRLTSAEAAGLDYVFLGSLAVGIGGSFGFMNPFLYTPAYFCFHTGKVPRKKMAIYGLGSAVICFLILWVFTSFYAPLLWDESQIKIVLSLLAPPGEAGGEGGAAPTPAPAPAEGGGEGF